MPKNVETKKGGEGGKGLKKVKAPATFVEYFIRVLINSSLHLIYLSYITCTGLTIFISVIRVAT